VGTAAGLQVRVVQSDGVQPIGTGIGPSLEARDVVRVLQNAPDAPAALRIKSVSLAGALLELAGYSKPGEGEATAGAVLRDGSAWRKFVAICEAQGGLRSPPVAAYTRPIEALRFGRIVRIDNRVLARIAKLAGAPGDKAAGLEIHVQLGVSVERGQPLYTIHAETAGELAYALEYVARHQNVIEIEDQ
jgi:thymidine phosphorylase